MKVKRKQMFVYAFVLPTFVFYSIFFLVPIVQSFYISFFRWSGLSSKKTFIGLANFVKLFQDDIVWSALGHNLFMLFTASIAIFILAMFFATVIARKGFKEAGIYRVVFLFPNMLSIVVISIIWMFIYNPSFGIVNAMLTSLGLESLIKVWLGDPATVLPALIFPVVWMQTGFYTILYLSGMQNIPNSLYEAADIEGASTFRQFFYITIPLLWEIIRSSLIFFVTHSFNITFALVLVTTKGGPFRSSELLTTYLYEQAFEFSDFGYGTAIGILVFVVMLVIAGTAQLISKREVVTYS